MPWDVENLSWEFLMSKLVLASTSRYRRALLDQFGLTFEAHNPNVDEDSWKAKELSPSELAKELAVAKAESLKEQFSDALIIGGDQVAEIDGEILDKPGTEEKARLQLKLLSGRTHHLWTALAVHDTKTGQTFSALEKHQLTLRALTASQIADYVKRDQPLDCVGSYRVEALGMCLFSSIEGNDYTAIIGLPMIQLVSLLEKFGVSILAQ